MINSNYTASNDPCPYTITEELASLPKRWAITPVHLKKPLRPGWQQEPPIDRRHLAHLIFNGQVIGQRFTSWTGIALRTGQVSGGILAVDCDGQKAIAEFLAISGGDIPDTVTFSSGDPSRMQFLFQLSAEQQEMVGALGIKKRILASGQQLEFRYNGAVSVLPASAHPSGRVYRWLRSPLDVPVAAAPEWLVRTIVQGETTGIKGAPAPVPRHVCRTLEEIDRSWTGPGQSNDILIKLANYGGMILGLKTVSELGGWIKGAFRGLKGFRAFASRDTLGDVILKNRCLRVAKSHLKGAWRYGIKRMRSTLKYQDAISLDFHQRLEAATQLALQKQGGIYRTKTEAKNALIAAGKELTGKGFSYSTLNREVDRWRHLFTPATVSLEALNEYTKFLTLILCMLPNNKGLTLYTTHRVWLNLCSQAQSLAAKINTPADLPDLIPDTGPPLTPSQL
jgi:hypothetical protein